MSNSFIKIINYEIIGRNKKFMSHNTVLHFYCKFFYPTQLCIDFLVEIINYSRFNYLMLITSNYYLNYYKEFFAKNITSVRIQTWTFLQSVMCYQFYH